MTRFLLELGEKIVEGWGVNGGERPEKTTQTEYRIQKRP
jgi:hypothetical protein